MVDRHAVIKTVATCLRMLKFQMWDYEESRNIDATYDRIMVYGNGNIRVTIRVTVPEKR